MRKKKKGKRNLSVVKQPFPAVITREWGERIKEKNHNFALEHDGGNEASRPLTAANMIGT